MSEARTRPAAIDRETSAGPAVRGAAVSPAAGVQRYAVALAAAATAGGVFLVHLPVLGHYFFGDDFVPLADISLRSTPRYLRDLLLLRDVTPNWRFLTGLVYLGEYRAFGANAFPYLLVAVLVHAATTALLCRLVYRAAGSVWPAGFAALLFGLSAAHVPTVGQVTAFNNVLAGFFLVLALLALYEGLEGGRLRWMVPASFAAAIAANDSAAVIAPVFGLAAFLHEASGRDWWRDRGRWWRMALVSAPYAAIGGAALLSFWACGCTQASRAGTWGAGDHIAGNVWIYLGRLLYPIGMEPPGEPGTAHVVAGSAVALLALVALVRGPRLARVAVLFLGLALVPYAPLHWALAPRYVYLASIPFAMVAGLLAAQVSAAGRALTPLAPAALGVLAAGAIALHAWQSVEQNASFKAETDDYRELVVALEERFPDLPESDKVYVRGGPLTLPLLQFTVLPSIGEVLYGGVVIAAVDEASEEFCDTPGGRVHVLDYNGGAFTPVVDPAVVHCPVATFEAE
jgi:hypothetical protein